jgi:hypothetical protein
MSTFDYWDWADMHLAQLSSFDKKRVKSLMERYIDSLAKYRYADDPKIPARITNKHKIMDFKDWEDPKNITGSKGITCTTLINLKNMPKGKTVLIREYVDMAEVLDWIDEYQLKVKYFEDVFVDDDPYVRKAVVFRSTTDAVAFKLKWA